MVEFSVGRDCLDGSECGMTPGYLDYLRLIFWSRGNSGGRGKKCSAVLWCYGAFFLSLLVYLFSVWCVLDCQPVRPS